MTFDRTATMRIANLGVSIFRVIGVHMRLTRVLYVLAQFRIRPRQIGPSHIHQITQTAYYAMISAMESRAHNHRFLLVERSFCAGTRAGMAHAHWLMTWFNVNGTRQISPRSPGLEIPKLVPTEKNAKFCLEKKLRDLSPSKGFQFVSLSFPKVEKPRFLF